MFLNQCKKKTVGYWFACAGALLALVSLIVYFVYTGKGGHLNGGVIVCILLGIVLQAVLFFYDGKAGDVIAVFPPILYMVAMMLSIEGGVGNIADDVNDIVMFGIKELAVFNYALAGMLVGSSILSIVSCFVTREKE